MNPALQNAPKPCQDPKAWRSKLVVRYPYMGVDSAEVVVGSLLPGLAVLDRAFDLAPAADVPQGLIGWDGATEKAYYDRLRALAGEASTFFDGPTKARKAINDLGKAAREALDRVRAFYTTDTRRMGAPLTQKLNVGDPTEWGPVGPGMILARNELRHDIIDTYRSAAQLLWCADYGMAEIEAYLRNRAAFEAPIKPTPGGLVDPKWTNYSPVEYPDTGFTVDPADLPDIVTEDPADIGGGDTTSGGGAAAVALGALAVGALFLLSRR